LARLKPHPSRLTSFYVMIALGGAIGGVLVALVAPHVLNGFYELPLGVALCAIVVLAVLRADPESGLGGPWVQPAPLGAALLTGLLAGYVGFVIHQRDREVRVLVRNFYGGLKVMDATAFALARENRMPIIVFSIREKGAIEAVLRGKGRATIVGT
jgi:hypothetical protein